ncbi:MAG: 1-acyl-sn-glycerol-3-phosphate acyltransferase [Bacteroidia bacterium]|nr:1-acyl-sn-glycerol-3-phosphate acyltransferase [Bacteroidia bacterium]
MIYFLLKPLITLSLRIYFRKREVRGAEHEPQEGPFIAVANHPGTLMDPMVIGASLRSRFFFLSKATVFKGPARWIFPKLGMIPVHRAHDDPSQIHKNKETFIRCYEHLEQGGKLLIFPEGVSFAQRKLQKIKTGTARIALDTEARNDFKLGIQILCVGLNYSASHRFQSDVFVNISTPIRVADYQESFRREPVAAVSALTECIRKKLEELTIALEDETVDQLVKSVERIYKAELLRELGYSSRDKEQDFILTRKIAEAVLHFKEKDPANVEVISRKIDKYFDLLDRLNINHHILSGKRIGWWKQAGTFLYFLIGFPFFLFGFLNNYIPFRLPSVISRSISRDVEWFGGMNMLSGLFLVIIFYGLQAFFLHRYLPEWFTFPVLTAYVISLPFSGLFAFYYWRRFTTLRGRWMLWALFSRKASLLSGIIMLREEILQDIRHARKEFENSEPA